MSNPEIDYLTEDNAVKQAEELGFYSGRMISYSKSLYEDHHPDHVILFNASIYARLDHEFSRIITGCDLDLTKDASKLLLLAEILEADIAVNYERGLNHNTEREFATCDLIQVASQVKSRHKLYMLFGPGVFSSETYNFETLEPKLIGDLAQHRRQTAKEMLKRRAEEFPDFESIPGFKGSLYSLEYNLISGLAYKLDPEWNGYERVPNQVYDLMSKASEKMKTRSHKLALKVLKRKY